MVTLSFSGCETKVLGRYTDTIKLSTKSLTFNKEGGIQQVTTQGDEWVIDGLEVSGNKLYYYYTNEEPIIHESIAVRDTIFIEGPETLENQGWLVDLKTPVEIKGEWFTIKRDLQEFTVELSENSTNKERNLLLILFGYFYPYDITVTQQP